MSKINWDNAPDWATHAVYRKVTREIICFDCERYMYEKDNDEYHHYYGDNVAFSFDELLPGAEARPTSDHAIKNSSKEWNGEGLPPVGTVCEYICEDDRWYRADILGYRNDFIFMLIDEMEALCTMSISGNADKFRLADTRTDKEKAIDEMKECVENGYFINKSCVYNAMKELYDAGYRKESNNE